MEYSKIMIEGKEVFLPVIQRLFKFTNSMTTINIPAMISGNLRLLPGDEAYIWVKDINTIELRIKRGPHKVFADSIPYKNAMLAEHREKQQDKKIESEDLNQQNTEEETEIENEQQPQQEEENEETEANYEDEPTNLGSSDDIDHRY